MITAYYEHLNAHVAESDYQVLRRVWRTLSTHGKSRYCRESRHALMRDVLEAHHSHQRLVREFRL
jgi:hypothetical protein